MSFKDNLKQKMLIDLLARKVSHTIGPPGRSSKLDKKTMRELLALGPFVLVKRRDLELYFRDAGSGRAEVLVLDNELPLYGNTTLDDVALRRSPELKEMVSIRNVIKILNDSDILISKGREALADVRTRTLELLDLRWQEQDIAGLAREGTDAVLRADSDSVSEILDLFAELLGFGPVPAEVMVNDYVMLASGVDESGTTASHGPVVMYNVRTNALRLIRHAPLGGDPLEREIIPRVAMGEIEPDLEGPPVFEFLKKQVLERGRPTIH